MQRRETMKRIGKRLGALIFATLALVGLRPAHADIVTDWNAIMQTTVSVAPTNPIFQARWAAIVQLAVFEAVNAVTGDYDPYLGTIVAPAGASPDAAAIAAAHRTLVTLRPGSAADLDDVRAKTLAAIPDGPAKEAGIATGEAAAAAVLLMRANDGSVPAVTTPYIPGSQPGDWQPAPPANAPAFLPGWGQVTPFALKEGAQFRLPPPPGLHTAQYARDYDEVKRLGRSDSPFRPQDRTDVARFFAAASPVQIWNSAARHTSAVQGKTLSENARTFALLAIAICDASIAAYDTKYHYNLWRPLTAIRGGGSDGNGKTDPDENWLPLIPTPAFPSYPSAHATLSGAASAVLEGIFGKNGHAITLTHPQVPGVILNYTAFNQICNDIDDARIYGGIHFRFDQRAGASQGRKVGKYILRNYLRSSFDVDFGDDD
jgi:hypothetical protein